MKHCLFVLSLVVSGLLSAQYWQQEVNYTIKVSLNDSTHTLSGFEEFEYVNNSPHTIESIYVHLWPNAYSSKETALAKQLYHSGELDLHFNSADYGGYIDSIDFKSHGEKITWNFDREHKDIAILSLPKALKTGDRIRISTPFRVKIPSGSISRLGHIGQSYQITQWYPKPAVFDKDGWHQMPYLNQGEFYSEYGSFEVEITLPSNYVVGATGDLQTSREVAFLDSLSQESAARIPKPDYHKMIRAKTPNGFPESSKTMKTIRYTQQNVHDFAWFADKRYEVLKSEVTLPHSGRKVTSWAMFTPKNATLWKKAPEYLNDGIFYYSLWNGDYPYNQVTAVDGTTSAGGGMEYPNVTVIGNSSSDLQLEIVIVHEVGHNWFYGQLGTNERLHGWMDEGLNTLNEVRYIQTKYPKNTALSDMVLNGSFHFDCLNHHDMSDYSYRLLAGMGEDQPIETHSADFTSVNYGITMYQKTGLVFYYLKDYLGDQKFDECMRQYYAQWEFKHPTPEDLRNSLEKSSGKNLDWLFEDLINKTDHVDFKLKAVKKTENGYQVKVKNVGQVDGPIEVNALLGDSLLASAWLEAGTKKDWVELKVPAADRIEIDYNNDIPEINRQNNSWKSTGIFKRFEKPAFEFLIGDNEKDRSNMFWTPVLGGNIYDKFMIGAAVHNYGIPSNPFTYYLAPMYSVGRNMVSGVGDFSRTYLPTKGLKLSRIGVSIKSFKHDSTYRNNDSYYAVLQPYWFAKIGNRKAARPVSQTIRLQGLYRYDQYGPSKEEQIGAYLAYDWSHLSPDHEFRVKLRNDFIQNLTSEESVARIGGEFNYRYRYQKQKRKSWMSLRLYAGHQYVRDFTIVNGYRYSMSLAGMSGSQDIFIDEFYFGRNEFSGMWSQQRQENQGGFRSTSYYGTTAYGIIAANYYLQLPIPTGIFGIFADAGSFHNGVSMNQAFQAGAAIRLGDFFGVYFPLYMSKQLNDSYGNSPYSEKVRFTLKFNLLNKPLNLNSLL